MMRPWHGLLLDALIVVCLTTLAAMHILPVESYLLALGGIIGAHARSRLDSNGGPPKGGSGIVGTSACLALVVGLASFLHFRSS